jgi:hypothetical protein
LLINTVSADAEPALPPGADLPAVTGDAGGAALCALAHDAKTTRNAAKTRNRKERMARDVTK